MNRDCVVLENRRANSHERQGDIPDTAIIRISGEEEMG